MNNFVVPYNFIPLLKEKAKADKEKGDCTGVIEYTLETKTPLFIPNSSNDHAFPRHDNGIDDHKSYDFFSYADLSQQEDCEHLMHEPVIPGSEMRGVLRSAYEILTNSCMSSINDQTQMSKRTMESFKPGLILRNENGTYDLCDAEICIARFVHENNFRDDDTRTYTYKSAREIKTKSFVQNSLHEGQLVCFDYKDRGPHVLALARNIRPYSSSDKRDCGYVIKGNDFNTKHCLHIIRDLGKEPVMSDIKLTSLHKSLKAYRDNKNPYIEYEKELDIFEKGQGNDMFPVYYNVPGKNRSFTNEDKQILMLSPAQKTREIYNLKLNDLVGSYVPCDNQDDLCPACSLFGTVNTRGMQFAEASKIRVADLHLSDESQKDCYDQIRNLAVLGGPKRNNMEFYIKRPDNAYFWTYEYYIDANGGLIRKKAQINGRKFYWHHNPDPDRAYVRDSDNSNQNVTVRPVRDNVRFKGKVYFQHISEKQLNQLIWLLNCGDEGNVEAHTHWLKMGMGKPLGFGSVSVAVDAVKLRKIQTDEDKGTIVNAELPYQWKIDNSVFTGSPELEINLTNFLNAANSMAVQEKNVAYPYINSDDKGFEWYTWNHGKRDLKNNPRQIIEGSKPNGHGRMPNNRSSMAYVYYMKAGEPVLQETTMNHVAQSQGKQQQHHNGSYHYHRNNNHQDQKKYKQS